MIDNRCPGLGVDDHEGHHSFCVACIEAKPPERRNEDQAKWLHLDDDEPWVEEVL